MKLSLQDRVFATLAYAGIFSFPLTAGELIYWLIGKAMPGLQVLQTAKKYLKTGWYQLDFGSNPSLKRSEKQVISVRKWQIAQKTVRILTAVPTIMAITVTGGLAMNNVTDDDDIDLLIVAADGTLWVTRFFCVIFLELIGRRRRPGKVYPASSVCLNMFLSADGQSLPVGERDLFAAHEILQQVVLFERDNWYSRFVRNNPWVREFLDNAWIQTEIRVRHYHQQFEQSFGSKMFCNLARVVDPGLRSLQLWYMQRRRTSEVVFGDMLRFHPQDARSWIRQKLAKKLGYRKLPLDKVFYRQLK